MPRWESEMITTILSGRCKKNDKYRILESARVRALSGPSGKAAEDNVVERENFWGGRNYVTDYGLRITGNVRTDRRGI